MYTGSYAPDMEHRFEDPTGFIEYLYSIQEQEERERVLCKCMSEGDFISWLESHTDNDPRFRQWQNNINRVKGSRWLYVEGLTGLELAIPLKYKRRIQILCSQTFCRMPEYWILQDEHLAYYRPVGEEGKAILARKDELHSPDKADQEKSDGLAVTSFRKMIEAIDHWMKDIKENMPENYVLYQSGVLKSSEYQIDCDDMRGYFIESETGSLLPIGYLREKDDKDSARELEKGMDAIQNEAVRYVRQLAGNAKKTKESVLALTDSIVKKSGKPGRFISSLAILEGGYAAYICIRMILKGYYFKGIINGDLIIALIGILAVLCLWKGISANIKCGYWKRLKKCRKEVQQQEEELTELVNEFERDKNNWAGREKITKKPYKIKDISHIAGERALISEKLSKPARVLLLFVLLTACMWYRLYSIPGWTDRKLSGITKIMEKEEKNKEETDAIQLEDESSVNLSDLTYIHPDQIEASSTLQSSSGVYYGPENLVDGELSTSWQEGAEGYGLGEAIRFSFAEAKQVKTVGIYPGSWTSSERFYANGRPKELTIVFSKEGADVRSDTVQLSDEMKGQFVVLNEPVECDSIYMRIDSAYEGGEYEDTVISEVGIYGNE